MKSLTIGLQHTSKVVVTNQNTAVMFGSGDMKVLATPEMVALMENAAMSAVSLVLNEEDTTVGCSINTSHIRPSALGATITATATLTEIDGRMLTFHVIAHDQGRIIGEGTHVRCIVNRNKFLEKMEARTIQ